MSELKNKKLPFIGVAMALILFGAAVFAVGMVAWNMSCFFHIASIDSPFNKVIGGAIITALGYVVLELELMRSNK